VRDFYRLAKKKVFRATLALDEGTLLEFLRGA
jgi:hypothetical protein